MANGVAADPLARVRANLEGLEFLMAGRKDRDSGISDVAAIIAGDLTEPSGAEANDGGRGLGAADNETAKLRAARREGSGRRRVEAVGAEV